MKSLLFTAIFAAISITGFTQTKLSGALTREEKLNEEYCSGIFKSSEGTILDLQSNNNGAMGYLNILDWLDGRVSGLTVYKTRNGNRIALIRGQQTSIYVDETPVNAGFLNSLPVSDIAMIKVIKSPFFGGFNGGGGAIAIYTIGSEEEELEDGGN